MSAPVAWIQGNWIFSKDLTQSGKFWIDGDWIWGPVGAANPHTRHWIQDGWICGPVGAPDVVTGFWIHAGWIWGPEERLPFARATGGSTTG